tara:strand:+ start:432 stop:977 length:546 start_codon:yes stop_codon:yes gene_type:complete
MDINERKLVLKYSYLNLESKEMAGICELLEPEIKSYMRKNYPDKFKKIYSGDPKPKKASASMKEKNKITNKEIKKIYRKIASKIHPDKTGEDSSLFLESAEAYRTNDAGKLLEIALMLNINIFPLSKKTIEDLELSINTIEENIQKIKSTTAWYWHNASSEEEKKNIVEYIIKVKEEEKPQ